MTLTIEKRIASCDRDRARLDTYLPTARKAVVVNVMDGQSNGQGGHGPNPNCPGVPVDVAYATDADHTDLVLRQLGVNTSGTGPDRMGAQTSLYGFAAELWETYGMRSINTMSAWQGMAVLPETPNGADPAWRWTAADDYVDLSLVRSSGTLGPQVRNQIVPHHRECLKIRPDLKVAYRICHWVQGEAEAPHLLSGVVTKAQYTAALQGIWNWRKSVDGFNLMVVHEHGRKGITAQEIADNEPMNVLVREAQADFVNANADVIWGSQAAKETGALAVDAGGAWVSGFEYATDDGGVHWTGDAQNAIGRLAARRAATQLGIT